MSAEVSVPVVGQLPADVRLGPLTPHPDDRGTFIELFREEWDTGVRPVQWNAVHSEAGVLRGVHVHPRHDDYLIVVRGAAIIGVRDLREGSSTEGACVELSGERPAAISIPHGVAHGFYFQQPSTHIYSVSQYWDMADELGCRWDDPALGIPWPQREVHISDRDAELPSLEVMLGELRAAWAG